MKQLNNVSRENVDKYVILLIKDTSDKSNMVFNFFKIWLEIWNIGQNLQNGHFTWNTFHMEPHNG